MSAFQCLPGTRKQYQKGTVVVLRCIAQIGFLVRALVWSVTFSPNRAGAGVSHRGGSGCSAGAEGRSAALVVDGHHDELFVGVSVAHGVGEPVRRDAALDHLLVVIDDRWGAGFGPAGGAFERESDGCDESVTEPCELVFVPLPGVDQVAFRGR